MFFAIPNLSAHEARRIENPWSEPIAPQNLLDASKVEFSRWCTTPTTKHCFFSAAEGLDPLRRISSENNRVVALHGFIADVDREIPDEHFTVEYIHKKCKTQYLPNYASRTHSGNGRLVWMFSTPVSVPNQKVATAFLKYLARELKIAKIWGAIDEKSWAPEQYYERGRDWISVSNEVIPEEMLQYWLFESGRDLDFTDDERELRIPWEKINDRFQELHPGKWPGPLEEGSRGPAFWRDTRSGNSAIVRKGGIQDFGGEFRTWSSLLGYEWVSESQGERLGHALKSFWNDEKDYFFYDPSDAAPVVRLNLGKLERKLKVDYNISQQKIKGKSYSELEEIVKKIDERVIAGAAPFIHFPPKPLMINGRLYLNTSRVRPLAPAPEPEEYKGQPIPFGFNFSYMKEILVHMFPKDQKGRSPLESLLATLRYKYCHALAMDPRPSQALVLMGKKDSGKTLLTEGVFAPMFGDPRICGSSIISLDDTLRIHQSIVGRPFDFAVGRTNHNDELQEYPVWTYDDERVRNDKELNDYTNFIKKTTASGSIRFNPKHVKAVNTIWRGLQTINCNDDGMSSRQLPNMDVSTLDKIMLFRVNNGFPFLPRAEGYKRIQEELPHFCRWLLNWKIPPHCIGTPRFEIEAYHDPYLLQMAYENGANYEFAEMLGLFLHNFREMKKATGEEVKEWVGTSSQLHVELNTWNSAAVRSYTPNSIGRSLKDLHNKGVNIRVERTSTSRMYYIPLELHLATSEDEVFDEPVIVPATEEDLKNLNPL